MKLPPRFLQRYGWHIVFLLIINFVFWLSITRYIDLPGFYMDAVNPDYLAAYALNSKLRNPVWAMPTALFPILGSLYHGVQNLYVDIPVLWFLGISVASVRIAQALFGSLIVSIFYCVLIKARVGRFISFLFSLALATEIAFIAAFRTQFYIILSGDAWLLASLLCLLWREGPGFSTIRKYLTSGVFFGLAVYSYFVFLFFLPAMYLLIARAEPGSQFRAIKFWTFGFIVGMLTYVAGYLSFFVARGGIEPGIQWLKAAVTHLSPLSSKLTLAASIETTFSNWLLAMNNGGNELMIFGSTNATPGLAVKTFALFAGLAAALAFSLFVIARRHPNSVPGLLALLPVSYFFLAAILGNRLWVHHFSLMVPLLYLILAVLLNRVVIHIPKTLVGRGIATTLGLSLIVCNLHQQNWFFAHLNSTGGVAKASNALSTLAEESLTQSEPAAYFFPEWGFFMSFALLTGNKIPYELDVSPAILKKHIDKNEAVNILYWNAEDTSKYSAALEAAGAIGAIRMRPFNQRDGKPAFYMLSMAPN